ncbi:MAG: polyprenyl synthetase, partial [Planctomycetaceae bacterium]|nr:polyprenyl synthetase [Planctomycetaceae bacterium]
MENSKPDSAPPAARPGRAAETLSDAPPVKRMRKRRGTSGFKEVPEILEQRVAIKSAAEQFARTIDKSRPFNRNQLERWARQVIQQERLSEKFLGFTAVLIGNFFWKQQFLAIPFEKRLLLLPHCLKHAEGCPADYDEFGLDCETCGACSIADYKVKAERLGYKVLVAEGSPIVLQIIVGGHVDGMLGVACLNVLEKAIDKVLIAGVPSYAVPLHSGDCKNSKLDEAWVWDVLDKYEPLPEPSTVSYIPLMRTANRLFEENFPRLLPPQRSGRGDDSSPLAKTEAISYDWLANGGKRFRPFITLAAYDAMTGGASLRHSGPDADLAYPDAVCRVAMAIEAFHKASLVHDDIEDDDLYRYGRETLHRQHDLGTAINVGDHLIGLGYQLLNSCGRELGAEIACDVTDRMAAAHRKLCDGQGAEMAWSSAQSWEISPLDALQIYALKTSPAFEAALYAGIRMAGDAAPYQQMIPTFSRHLGVAFQILNDLKDWMGDDDNKLVAGQDALALRPTILLALAMDAADDNQRFQLNEILDGEEPDGMRIGHLRRIFEACGVLDKAERLVEKSRSRAQALADEVDNEELRQLLH